MIDGLMENHRQKDIDDGFNKLEDLLKKFKRKGPSAYKEMNQKEQKAVFNWSKNITRQYTSLIENDLSNVKDLADLPCPKDDIRMAIKVMLPIFISNGPQGMVKKLKLAYQELGSFQQIDTGDFKRIMTPATSKDIGSPKKMRRNLHTYNEYLEVTISERKTLFQEIENYVDGLKYMISDEN